MEHSEAVELRLAERYLLGELSPEESEAFEAHFFECQICADEVRRGARLAANLRAVISQEMSEVVVPVDEPARINIKPAARVLDLRIPLSPEEHASRIRCEFHFEAAAAPLVQSVGGGQDSLRVSVPVDRLREGPCTLVLRDELSAGRLGERRLTIIFAK